MEIRPVARMHVHELRHNSLLTFRDEISRRRYTPQGIVTKPRYANVKKSTTLIGANDFDCGHSIPIHTQMTEDDLVQLVILKDSGNDGGRRIRVVIANGRHGT